MQLAGKATRVFIQAISLNPNNAVYYSNRAAAYSSMGEYEKAVEDAEEALITDPMFSKAYHRLG